MNNIEVPATPLLANVPRVELGTVGTWNISNMNDWHPTADDFASAVAALECPAVRRPVLKFGHTGEPGEGDPAIGLIDNMALSDDGQTLVGDFVGVPAWLAEVDDNGNSVLSSAYPDRSGEWQHNYVCQLGHTHPFVLHAMALLGVVRPGIGTLESLYDLYAKAPEKEPLMPAASTGVMGSSVTPDQIRKAYYNGPGTDWNLWIREFFIDPPELIVQNDNDDTLIRVAYTITGEDIEFGDPQSVKVEYVAARAGVSKPIVAFASRAEARPAASSSAPPEEPTEEKEATMPALNETLRQRLGLAEDATDEAVLEALDAALPAEGTTAEADELSGTGTEAPADTTPAQPEVQAASGARGDVVAVDRAQWEATVAAAAEGQQARRQQQREERERVVSAAIKDGRIPPARRDHWLQALETDPEGNGKALASLAPGLIPVSEMGHSLDTSAPAQDLGWFDSTTTKEA